MWLCQPDLTSAYMVHLCEGCYQHKSASVRKLQSSKNTDVAQDFSFLRQFLLGNSHMHRFPQEEKQRKGSFGSGGAAEGAKAAAGAPNSRHCSVMNAPEVSTHTL